jgi:hypothetical protein
MLALISQSQLSASFIFVTNNWILIEFSGRVNVIYAVTVQLFSVKISHNATGNNSLKTEESSRNSLIKS